ncbi:cellulase family glycosylhydrolase [Rhodococcoides kroppenstedtii]|uniref:cellulase family glycosylhydrolase n=1 Tax=Rhodococcoides kroppenstedtii TaxID=293050 RepID=UPI001BDEA613|nr:cellulase family glycosylhydrolase [Rhodococcus kroppenstedtii]MBT1191123.1 cellulase family glycosylhydrolase [Rhodococcus kroppenstedtii]
MTALDRRRFLGAASALLLGSVAGCAGESVPSESTRPGPTGTTPPVSANPTATVLGYSTGASVLWADPDLLARTMDAVRDGGVSSVRVDISWNFAEPSRGRYDWTSSDRVVDAAVARGLTVLATLTNTPTWAALGGSSVHTTAPRDPVEYGRFAGAVAERYRGRVAAYEIWNEPNGTIFFGPKPDPVRYTAMLREAYTAIRAADPGADVVAGATGNTATENGQVDANEFVTAVYDAGGQGYFDALSYHPYDYGMPLGDGTRYPNSPMQQMIRMHRLMAEHGDGAKPIWITEYGAPTTDVDPIGQARLICDSARQWTEVSFAGPFYVYTLRDADSASEDPEDRFGVLTDTFDPKPGYEEFAALAASGVPPRPIVADFEARAREASLGEAWSPVFPLSDGYSQQFAGGSVYSTPRGWFVSPPAIADLLRPAGLLPVGPFVDGIQDFASEIGVRAYSHPVFGTHAVYGAILSAWEPRLGFPVTAEYAVEDGGRAQDFENGRITWAVTGETRVFSS